MIVAEGAVLGVDVGCSPTKRSSAICLLHWNRTDVDWTTRRFRALEPEREHTIAAMVGQVPLIAAAFDGPLRPGLDMIGRYRTAERMLTRRLRPLIGKPGQSSTPVGKLLNHHANMCVRHVLAHGALHPARHPGAIAHYAIAEAFPSAFLGLMIADPQALAAKRADRSDRFFVYLATTGGLAALFDHCLPGRRLIRPPADITNHDDRAALVCALTALCLARKEFVAVGEPIDGYIILPPRRFIQNRQWDLLNTNAGEEAQGSLLVSDADA